MALTGHPCPRSVGWTPRHAKEDKHRRPDFERIVYKLSLRCILACVACIHCWGRQSARAQREMRKTRNASHQAVEVYLARFRAGLREESPSSSDLGDPVVIVVVGDPAKVRLPV